MEILNEKLRALSVDTRIDAMSTTEYLYYKYAHYDIHPDKVDWNNPKIPFGVNWWNSCSLTYPVPCKICARDNERFFEAKRNGKDVSRFEEWSRIDDKSKIKQTHLKKECTPFCFWHDYFMSRRRL
jgi:hypothetical protein